jgi:hypothetical protein
MAVAAPTRRARSGSTTPAAGSAATAAPPAERGPRPRWRDGRLLVGLLLVLLSVVIGARVVATADASAPWVSVRTDLPAGHVLTGADLATIDARFAPDASRRYFGPTATTRCSAGRWSCRSPAGRCCRRLR